jgi:hypothetical protein
MDMARTPFGERLKDRETIAKNVTDVEVMLAMTRAMHSGDADQAAFILSTWLFKHQLRLSATAALELLSHAHLTDRSALSGTSSGVGLCPDEPER